MWIKSTWKICWNWNIGNHRAVEGQEFTILKGAWELGTSLPAGATQISPPAGVVLHDGQICYLPAANKQKFAAFNSLSEGMDCHLSLLKRRYKSALDRAELADFTGYVNSLKSGGYFTGPAESYIKAVNSMGKDFLKYVNELHETQPEPVKSEESVNPETNMSYVKPNETIAVADFIAELASKDPENII